MRKRRGGEGRGGEGRGERGGEKGREVEEREWDMDVNMCSRKSVTQP